jgi:hypothetical protein
MYAVELLAACSRVMGQHSPVLETLGEQDGHCRFRLLDGPVDGAAGLFHGPVTGARAELPSRQS